MNIQSIVRKIPLIFGLLLGVLWASIYALFGMLHSMWQMFNKGFPFIIADVIGVHNETMSTLSGVLFALVDGMLFGILFGLISSEVFI
jgi:hypothetical protein